MHTRLLTTLKRIRQVLKKTRRYRSGTLPRAVSWNGRLYWKGKKKGPCDSGNSPTMSTWNRTLDHGDTIFCPKCHPVPQEWVTRTFYWSVILLLCQRDRLWIALKTEHSRSGGSNWRGCPGNTSPRRTARPMFATLIFEPVTEDRKDCVTTLKLAHYMKHYFFHFLINYSK